jgi:hypothetical protein
MTNQKAHRILVTAMKAMGLVAVSALMAGLLNLGILVATYYGGPLGAGLFVLILAVVGCFFVSWLFHRNEE